MTKFEFETITRTTTTHKIQKKYRLCDDEKLVITNSKGKQVWLRRVIATQEFDIGSRIVKPGDLGGFIESEHNLSHHGACWLCEDSQIYDRAMLIEDAHISDTVLCGNVLVRDRASIAEDCYITDNVIIVGDAQVHCNVRLAGSLVVTRGSVVEHGLDLTGDYLIIGTIVGNSDDKLETAYRYF